MTERQKNGTRFGVGIAAYVLFFCIPAVAPTNPLFVLAEVVCAAFACVSMATVVLRGTGAARTIAVVLGLPPLVFLVYIALAALSGGLVPADA